MNNSPKEKFIGTLSQKELVRLYAKHVNGPKVKLFKSFGFDVIPGIRNGVKYKTLEGSKPGEPPLEIYNCRSSGGVFNLGHHNPRIIQVLKDALDEGLDLGDHLFLSEQRALLGKKLADLLPGDISKTTFGVSGGESIDVSIKFSRAYTQKKGCISAIGGFHGHTGFALLTGDPAFRDIFLWNHPKFKQVPFGDIDSMRKAIDDDVACVILETIPAVGGVLIAPKGYFPAVRELCEEKGTMLIIDEVQAGLGRTGSLWAIDGGLYPDEKVVPDFIVLAKGMSAGIYPISTCSYRPFIERRVFKKDPVIHASTTGGSDLGCVVALEMLKIQSDPKFLEDVKKRGDLFGKGLQTIVDENPNLVKAARGRGLIWGLEFFNDNDSILSMVYSIKEGVLLNYCGNKKDTLIIMPPLITKEKEMEDIIERIRNAVTNVKRIKSK